MRLKKEGTYKLFAIFCILLLIVALLPLLFIGRYAHPCADDYGYGAYAHAIWSTTHSFIQTIQQAVRQVQSSYDTWQGTFSSILLMALSPAIWGEGYYFLTPVIMLSILLISLFYLTYVILVKFLHARKELWCSFGCILCFLTIEMVQSPVNAFYWYNGAVHYVFMHGCMLALVAVVLHLEMVRKLPGKIGLSLLSIILSVTCGGANYSTALLGLVCLFIVLVLKLLFNKRSMWIMFPIISYSVAFYKSVTAYGNTIRQTHFSQSPAMEAILKSFSTAAESILSWINIPLLLFVILIIPVIWKIVSESEYTFRCPFVVTILSFCLLACMFTPPLYSMSGAGPIRLINIVRMNFYLLLLLDVLYWIGFLCHRLKTKFADATCITGKLPDIRIYFAGVLCLIFLCFKLSSTALLDYSSYAAYISLRAGEAEQFHEDYLERISILESNEAEVSIMEYSVKPYLLYQDDITPDASDWRNNAMQRWYGKEKITLILR